MAESLHRVHARLQPEQYALLARFGRTPRKANGGARRGVLSGIVRLVGIVVVTAALLGTLLLVLSGASTGPREPRWQSELDGYLAYRAGSAEGPATVLATSHAQRPSQFRSDLTTGSSNGVFLATRYGSDAQPVAFPPGDAWCVLVRSNDGLLQVAYVVQKVSLYDDNWLVHEGPVEPFTPQFLAALDRIGCDLPVSR